MVLLKRAVVFGLVVLGLVVGNAEARSALTPAKFAIVAGAEEPQALEAIPSSITFKDVPAGEKYSQTVRVSNTTGAALRVTGITATGEGIYVAGLPTPMILDAGGSATFNVFYQPTAGGSALGDISISNSADAQPVHIEVKAWAESRKGKVELEASAQALNFDAVTVGSQTVRSVTLVNRGNQDVKISQVTVEGSDFHLDTGGEVTLAPEQSTDVVVSFAPVNAGGKTGVLSVRDSAAEEALRIALTGSAGPASDHSFVLHWDTATTEGAGYFVYRGSTPGGPYTKLNAAPLAEESYTDSGLIAGQTYYYVITSVVPGSDESDFSAEIPVVVP
jgi:Abnormal spindle-like microcephaly-assoc'd, ASPM-SPD-2-Hydin